MPSATCRRWAPVTRPAVPDEGGHECAGEEGEGRVAARGERGEDRPGCRAGHGARRCGGDGHGHGLRVPVGGADAAVASAQDVEDECADLGRADRGRGDGEQSARGVQVGRPGVGVSEVEDLLLGGPGGGGGPVDAHAARVPGERGLGHGLGVLAEGERVEHPGGEAGEAVRDLADHLGAGVHALDAGGDLLVVAGPQVGVVEVVQVLTGRAADRGTAVGHGDVQRGVALAQEAGHEGSHDAAAHDENVGAGVVRQVRLHRGELWGCHSPGDRASGVHSPRAHAPGVHSPGAGGPNSSVSMRSRASFTAPTRGRRGRARSRAVRPRGRGRPVARPVPGAAACRPRPPDRRRGRSARGRSSRTG